MLIFAKIGVTVIKFFLLLFFSFHSILLSDPSKRQNHFFGHWTLDLEKSLSVNGAPKSSLSDIQTKSIDHRITFSRTGKYQEKLGNVITKGTWSRYKEDLATARLEGDEKIAQRRARLKSKLYNNKLTRYQKTRIEQKLYFLDRASVRSYDYQDGYLILNLNRQDKDIKLFFRKGI